MATDCRYIRMDLTWWILVFTTFFDGVYGGMTRVFTQDYGASNLVPSGTTPVHVRRITECARICSGTTSCIGFYHSDNQRSCDLNVGQNFTGFVSDSTATYYTYSVPEVSSSNCPASFISDIRILGSSGDYYNIKCVHEAGNHTEAQTGCSGHGMTLFRPNDVTKVNDVAAFLTACAAYNATSYWTDAQKYLNEPGWPWKNSDGSSVPDLAFYNHVMGNTSHQLCARLQGTNGYLLNDRICDLLDPAYGYICE